ncbi:MAG: SUMF1/EgtB/PvdO family nonheme iron enzyme [Anaerolineae bacterium]|nr:SUMF1/EgtB/PvdO family nonheme iron enzyme [Anaerolineae bacterium]
MLISFDKTKFPLVVVEDVGVEVHILPVTKVQFEQFMAETGSFSVERYEAMLGLNPAVGFDSFTPENRERLFVTGILPGEALDFAHWLGEGYDLPTVTEWRKLLAALRREPPPRQHQLTDLIEAPSDTILERLETQLHIRSMLDYTLMRGGLVEWVWQDKHPAGLGVPRPQFHANLWNPLVNVVKPLRHDQRIPYFGFRLIRRGEWYLADKDNARFVF